MKKDIEIPIVEGVYIAVLKEWDDEFLAQTWNSYIINDRDVTIEMVLVVTKGYDEERKTSLLRHGIGTIAPKSSAKIEMLQEELLKMNNEFAVTFFADSKLYEKKYIFKKNTINENAFQDIPVMDQRGVLIK
ncbi:hypothetical protein D1816_15630 [Aquimarina sp. AD10]|uniref:Phenylalanyl-tRNA synthetase subunit alpha n=1 Tax=Aquimarina aggregata TaxID=1642818 RepID=A0A162FCS6_9FLAO|nr:MULTISPECIES: hypothetical protein [Aquimarina]AXT61724.1 hypothetical protein D1816_15630 [Aquimarina sp. AD10]KZS41326.1 hypothetical protein AWE51_21725 [Aquimarina aggregata]RKN00926.1 hypothetical protein D7033_06135 [Aquimarina sp. AD10]